MYDIGIHGLSMLFSYLSSRLQTLKIYNTFNSLRYPIQGILQGSLLKPFPTNIYLFKVNNGNTKKRCKMCSKLTIKAPERRHWGCCGVFIDLNCTKFTPFSSVTIVDFEQVDVSWVSIYLNDLLFLLKYIGLLISW